MAVSVSQTELKAALDAVLAKMTAARPKVDSFAALFVSLKQQLADAIANAGDLTEAADAVASIMSEYESQVDKISAAADAPGGSPVGP